MLVAEKNLFRAFDDGEPNHSAGDPILGQIRSKDLTYVLIVVVRYFGGVKLGVGGLITAYKTAAEDALNKAIVVEKEVEENFTIRYDYSATAEIMRLVKDFHLVIVDQNFSEGCVLFGRVTLKCKVELIEKIKLLNVLGIGVDVTL
jgi:putative IMPACT (imprinted ancient) family translation regulator